MQRIIAYSLSALLLLDVFFLISSPVVLAENAPSAQDALAVSTVTVRAELRDSLERVPGTVRPKLDATLESRIAGRIEKVLFEEGAPVEKGALLIAMDAQEMTARLQQALAAERQAQKDLERYRPLLSAGAVTKQEFEDAETRAHVAEASVREAKTLADYTEIHAPFSGVITQKLVDEGDQAQPGRPLLVIEAADSFRFESNVAESIAAKISLQQTLEVQLAGLDSPLSGAVAEISPTTDTGSRTRKIKLDLPSSSLLRSGQYGYVLVPGTSRPSMQIPDTALIQRGQLELVFVVRDGKAVLKIVRSGKRLQGGVEIVSGLIDGDVVITSQIHQLREGRHVEVQQ